MMSQEGVKTRLGIMRSHLKSGMCAGIIQVPRTLSFGRDNAAHETYELCQLLLIKQNQHLHPKTN